MRHAGKISIFIALLVWFVPIFSVKAQSLNASSVEEVALAFYKTGAVVPNFDYWVRKTDPYLATVQTRRDKVYAEELSRLRDAYSRYDPKNSVITVRTRVLIHFEEQEEQTHMRLEFLRGHIDYFPYSFLDQIIAVIPNDLQSKMSTPLTQMQEERIRRHLPKTQPSAHLVIELRPDKADLTKPHMLDGTEQWLFLTDIAAISLWNKDGILLWEYTAADYIAPETQEIQRLYKGTE